MQSKTYNIVLFALTMFSLAFLYFAERIDSPIEYRMVGCFPATKLQYYVKSINGSALEISIYKNCCTSINVSYSSKTLFIEENNDKVCRCMCQCDMLFFNIKPEKIVFIDFTGKIHHISFENGTNTS